MKLEQLLLEALIEEVESSQTYKAALKNTGKDIKDGAKQLIGAANDAGATAIQTRRKVIQCGLREYVT